MKTAILIDEDLGQRNALSTWLVEEGWRVLVAEDGESGLDLTLSNRAEIVVCDLLMPRCNGFQLCRMVRQEAALKTHTRIIVTTGGGYPTDRANALRAGADECQTKPLRRFEFMKLVSQLMGEGETAFMSRQEAQRAKQALLGSFDPVLPVDAPAMVRFWGVRGSIPTPGAATVRYGGNTACVEVRAGGQIIILDAGTGIAPLGAHLVNEFRGRPFHVTLLISHTHWDHIQGFPFFEPAYNPQNRVRIVGYKGAREGLESTLSGQMESPYFPISMAEMPSNILIEEMRDLKFNIGPVEVEATYLNHPGLCMGFRINTSGGAIAYLPDNEPYQRFKYHSQTGDPAANVSPEAVEYARRQDQRIIDFVSGAEVLIIDSQYDATEYQNRIGWGHGCVDDVVALALSAKVKRLFLFHHDPRHDDDHMNRMVEWGRNFVQMLGESVEVQAAQEGLEIVLAPSGTPA
jgi:phosphoribosyl 1,2-cyclic phosphodiesterase/CheY-like chemotaxis protein